MGDISNLKQDNKGPSGHSNLKKDSRDKQDIRQKRTSRPTKVNR